MGASWFVRPETRRLSLSDGEWVLVKQRLNAGEFRAHLKRSTYLDADGNRRIDTLQQGLSTVLAFLLDWSLDDPIRGISESDLLATLDNLDPSRFAEIKAAIDAHETAMTMERNAEKNGTGGEKNDAAISPSPSAAVGLSPGSETLM